VLLAPLQGETAIFGQEHRAIFLFLSPYFSLYHCHTHTHRPSLAACSAWVQHLRYAEDINLHSYTWPTTKMNPYHTWITSLSVHSHFKHAALISILYQTGVYIQSKETPSVFSHQMVRKGRKFYCSSVRLFVLAFVTVKWLLPWGRRFLFTLSHYFLSQERDESNIFTVVSMGSIWYDSVYSILNKLRALIH